LNILDDRTETTVTNRNSKSFLKPYNLSTTRYEKISARKKKKRGSLQPVKKKRANNSAETLTRTSQWKSRKIKTAETITQNPQLKAFNSDEKKKFKDIT